MKKIKSLCFLFLFGCSLTSMHQGQPVNYDGVDTPFDPENSEIEIKSQETGALGPSPLDSAIQVDQKKRAKIRALDLAASGYRSVSYIQFLKEAKKNKIDFQIISGTGLGALIAALYAKYDDLEKVEWAFFKAIRIINGKGQLQSTAWKNRIIRFIDEEFGKDQFGTFKKIYCIPRVGESAFEDKCFKKGKITQLLKEEVFIHKLTTQKFADRKIVFTNAGADIVYRLEASNKPMTFKYTSEQLIGLYGKISLLNENVTDENNFNVLDILGNLDDISKVQLYLDSSKEKSKNIIKEKFIEKEAKLEF